MIVYQTFGNHLFKYKEVQNFLEFHFALTGFLEDFRYIDTCECKPKDRAGFCTFKQLVFDLTNLITIILFTFQLRYIK